MPPLQHPMLQLLSVTRRGRDRAQVGQDAEHPELCERCLPVIMDMGFQPPAPAAQASSTPEPATAAV